MKKNSHYDCDDYMGEEKPDMKRRGRKSKKQNDKEIMNEFKQDIERETSISRQRSYYENIHHLSSNEKKIFESKFTTPKNQSQDYYFGQLKNKNKKIVVATGPAGTGKTLFATEWGVRNFLLGNYEKLIFTRPSVSVDEDLGYLPGTLEEKMAPWVRPIYDILYEFITPKEVTTLMEDKLIEIAPLGYMRGRTFKNSWIVADEMQNSTIAQMKMLMTRLGENSRMIITGDLEQLDRSEEINGLDDFLDKFKGKRSSSITSVEFQKNDIQREEVVKEVLDIYGGDIPACYEYEEEEEDNTTSKTDI
jgi:phosphate starvation-inducible protein PhoH and related proteins